MKMKVYDYDEMLKEELKDPEFRKEYQSLEEKFGVVKQAIDMQVRNGMKPVAPYPTCLPSPTPLFGM